MRRLIGPRDYPQHRTQTLTVGQRATVSMPLCSMYRITCNSVGAGASLLYRGVKEAEGGIADSTDTGALNSAFCAVLSATAPDSGWIDAQPSAIRVEAVVGTVTFTVSWTSRELPAIA